MLLMHDNAGNCFELESNCFLDSCAAVLIKSGYEVVNGEQCRVEK